MTDWNNAPKIAGEMFDQSKRLASSNASRIAESNENIRRCPSNRAPLT